MDSEQRGREIWHERLARIVNSAACFVFAYVLLTQLYWIVMAVAGTMFEFDAFAYYYGVKFMLQGSYWSRFNVFVIYSSGALFVLCMGILGMFLYSKLKNIQSVANVLFLWMFVTGTGIFCAQLFMGTIVHSQYVVETYNNRTPLQAQNISATSTVPLLPETDDDEVYTTLNAASYSDYAVPGLGVALAWLELPAFLVYLLAIAAVVMLIYFSASICRPFLLLAHSYSKVNKLSRKQRYFLEVLVVPYAIGALGTTLITYPENLFAHGVQLAVIFISLMIAFTAIKLVDVQKADVLRYKTLQKFNPYLLVSLAFLIAFVMLIRNGVYLS
ncbi:MAG: hypothetical protein KIS94_13045 [Chitinophagales bacterium]|nr:hypothetical protein [Chitinophagales bacterium]